MATTGISETENKYGIGLPNKYYATKRRKFTCVRSGELGGYAKESLFQNTRDYVASAYLEEECDDLLFFGRIILHIIGVQNFYFLNSRTHLKNGLKFKI